MVFMEKTSMTSSKRIKENESPCLTPLSFLKGGVEVPIKTENKVEVMYYFAEMGGEAHGFQSFYNCSFKLFT